VDAVYGVDLIMNRAIRIALFAALSLPLAAQSPSISNGGVVNTASYTQPVAPGSVASVFGTFGGVGAGSAANTPLPSNLSGLSFTVGGVPVPLYFASNAQANIQIPWELAGPVAHVITPAVNGNPGSSQTVPVSMFAPGIFTMSATALVQTGLSNEVGWALPN